jgi:hypothetical protein
LKTDVPALRLSMEYIPSEPFLILPSRLFSSLYLLASSLVSKRPFGSKYETGSLKA